MHTVYLLSNKTIAKIGKDLVIEAADGKRQSVPMGEIDCVVLSRHAQISMPLIFALLEQGTPISFVNEQGELVASMGGNAKSVRRFLTQCENMGDDFMRFALTGGLIREKIRRQKLLVRSYARQKRNNVLGKIAAELSRCRKNSKELEEIEELCECEIMATKMYYNAFSEILDQSLWPWEGRNSNPAHDPVNVLLNLGYASLERETRLAVIGARLDPRIGHFHTNDEGKDCFVYDLMELFRQPVTDRFTLQILNDGTLTPRDFTSDGETGCRLTEKAVPVWCAVYEDFMTTPSQDFEGKAPREWVREEIRTFAERQFGA